MANAATFNSSFDSRSNNVFNNSGKTKLFSGNKIFNSSSRREEFNPYEVSQTRRWTKTLLEGIRSIGNKNEPRKSSTVDSRGSRTSSSKSKTKKKQLLPLPPKASVTGGAPLKADESIGTSWGNIFLSR